MDYIMFWISSIVICTTIDIIIKLDLCKSLADSGYKFKIEKDNNLEKKRKITGNILSKIRNFIPIYNMCYCLINAYTYYNIKNDTLAFFESLGAIEKMSQSEKEEYNKKKTGFYALKMHINGRELLDKISVIELDDESKITYAFDRELLDKEEVEEIDIINSIIILHVEGRAKYLNEFQQRKTVYNYFNSLLCKIQKSEKNKGDNQNIVNISSSCHNQTVHNIKISEEKEDINNNKIKKRVRRR